MENNNVDERNYGIDFLRIIAMFFVIVLHCLKKGGILDNAIINSTQYKFSWLLEIFAFSAVNIFGIISGYVIYRNNERKFKLSNYIKLWFEVVFYGIVINIIFNIINPSIVSKKDYLKVCFPITFKIYWYFTAYTAVLIFTPFINKAIKNCSNSSLTKLFVAIIILFSIVDTVTNGFILNQGYSFVWLFILYVLGAIIKKCEIGKNLKTYKIIIGIILLCFITYLYKMYAPNIHILNIDFSKRVKITYVLPSMVGIAILYVIGFSKIKFNGFLKRLVKFAAPSAFSIYIINNHKFFWKYVMDNLFISIANSSIIKIFTYVIGFSILFVVSSILIDKIRILIFKILHIDEFSNKIANIINKIFDKITYYLINS